MEGQYNKRSPGERALIYHTMSKYKLAAMQCRRNCSREAPDAGGPGAVRGDVAVPRAAAGGQPLRVALHRQGALRHRLRGRHLPWTVRLGLAYDAF